MMHAVAVSKRVAKSSVAAPVQKRHFISVVHKYVEAYNRYGFWDSLWKLYNPGDIKFGYKVGEDQFGNEYYEDPTEVAGQQRYTEFKLKTHDEYSGDQIPPEWHLWMHQTTDSVPGEGTQKPENWAKVPISTVSHAPYDNHLGPTVPYYENPTLIRQRVYGEDNYKFWKQGEPERYYLQPGHPLRSRGVRQDTIFDHIDPNNPDAPPKNSSAPLRSLEKN
ncbi:hypothetical protein LEN26_006102 [Aphanomyces euteiches]|uniref:NADH dehydrogenase [ubiquinone] 1 alpha subcomplex subunit 12 n=1 Tax=Aphanomyces euteiches TaxID=100861 RepID=A0A6G0WPF7_9STRA|nr:hypothetical protein Ae201684_013032 [Aphanomyces euteiches]KAH9076584.1 hypothetical protein Ae201684P_010524 [Aphanomyces euteiches]KAH9110098.1 hypothetical protein AeMF1_014973 [Aphanomyces euteiches]KAH9136530.1 hypothetical protein LEN26_006102 [Aphanomyces euteiches]KAH9138194.1 hypothetical protein AeRB84_017446 [Aphanomyces euteiches]